ncbi:hypothetical protein HY468_00570 [Candidatus Roizmanbacteria bacterium]|nr:hypothetical protein [Candidatus Roizmanbacteria bacterium]
MKKFGTTGIVLLFIIAALVLGAKSQISLPSNRSIDVIPAAHAAPGTKEAFDYLSGQTSSYCSLVPQTVDGYADDQTLQGACCSAMNYHRYQEQVEGLKKYNDIPQIPEDPYNISAALAKQLFAYQQLITLNEQQQAVYDQAMELSHEGGPCCCKCWRWSAFEGLAKYLITKENFDSEQIADLWDLLDGCGGSGHAGDGH